MKRVACYVRVSTEEQKLHGISVDSQISALKDYCKENNYTVAGIYNDAGISARKSYKKRPALLKLLEEVKSGKVDLIIFTKLDRWFRSVADYYEVQRVLDKYGVKWRCVWEDYEIETSSGVFKVNIMLSVAQSEADRTSERIKAVNEYRRLCGDVYVGGKAPTGYIKKNKGLIVDESAREGIQAFFNEYLNSFNLGSAVKVLRSNGVNVTKQTATRMLKNTAYCGNASGYKCEAFITEEQHQIIVKSCESRSFRKTKNPSRIYLFTGIARCESCGGAFSGSFRAMSSGNIKREYRFYRCHRYSDNAYCNNPRTISENKIEAFLLNNLESELEQYNLVAKTSKYDVSNSKAQIIKLKQKLERIGERYEDGDITKKEYKEKRQNVLIEIDKLNNELNDIQQEKTLPANWKDTYISLDESHKRAFWHSIIDKIIISNDGSIIVKFN